VGLPHPGRPGISPVGTPARLAAVGSAVVVFTGLPAVAGAAGVLGSVEAGGWRWLGGALAFAVLGRAAMAGAVVVSVARPIALGRAFAATMSTDSATMLRGRRGGRAVAARFLESAGVLPEAAERATVRSAGGAVAGATLVAASALGLGVVEGRLSAWSAPESTAAVLLVGAAALLLAVIAQVLTRRGAGTPAALRMRPGRRAGHPSSTVAVRWAGLIGWSAVGIALEGAALAAALQGVGAAVPLLSSTAVYAVLRLLWIVVPVLALPGAGEVALLLALTALGAPVADACAAVLAYRLLAFWLPVGLGALLLRSSRPYYPT
jgi:uncharacterized membrane protein YbhN (UPF0104 family)